jgi:hypothetical protein
MVLCCVVYLHRETPLRGRERTHQCSEGGWWRVREDQRSEILGRAEGAGVQHDAPRVLYIILTISVVVIIADALYYYVNKYEFLCALYFFIC